MKQLIIISIFLLITLISSITIAKLPRFGIERMEEKSKISFQDIMKKVPCYPNLISHRNQEKGFASKMEVKYGEIGFVRTDIGEPDGNLLVSLKGKKICEIELSLMPDIYFQSKNKLLLIYGYSGSNQQLELFSLENECKYIGWADIISKSELDEIRINWYHQSDGSKICQNN